MSGETRPKPKAAASLTADVVARGRQRTRAYGEAGLWRGAGAPPAAETPLRVALPPAPGEEEPAEIREDPVQEELQLEEARETPEPRTDLGLQLLGAALVFAAVFVLGILLF